MATIFRVYIGSSNQTATISDRNKEQVIKHFSSYFDSLTIESAIGFFKGKQEETMIINIATEDRDRILKVVSELRENLEQEGIGIEENGQYFRVTSETKPVL